MKVRTFGYFFKESLRSLVRNKWMAIASVSTVAISLLILGGALIWVFNTNSIVQSIEDNLEIAVFLRKDIDEDQAITIGRRIEVIDQVAETRFVSRDDAMEMFRKQFEERRNLLNALGNRNPLPHQFKVKVKVPESVPTVAREIDALAGVETVRYGQEWIHSLFNLTRWTRLIGGAIMVLIGGAAVFLISTTIRLTVFARRREIQIMRYIGATTWFIRWPFILEGLILGLSGAVAANLVLSIGYSATVNAMQESLTFLPLRTDALFHLQISQILISAGVLIGVIGSVISVRKFLRV